MAKGLWISEMSEIYRSYCNFFQNGTPKGASDTPKNSLVITMYNGYYRGSNLLWTVSSSSCLQRKRQSLVRMYSPGKKSGILLIKNNYSSIGTKNYNIIITEHFYQPIVE